MKKSKPNSYRFLKTAISDPPNILKMVFLLSMPCGHSRIQNTDRLILVRFSWGLVIGSVFGPAIDGPNNSIWTSRVSKLRANIPG